MISLEDRYSVYDTIARYVWNIDLANAEGLATVFTHDGTITDLTGKRWDAAAGGVRGFGAHWFGLPDRRGGQHLVQLNELQRLDEGTILAKSYWNTVKWDLKRGDGSPFVDRLGTYTDRLVKVDGQWLFKEKLIAIWNSDTAPVIGLGKLAVPQ